MNKELFIEKYKKFEVPKEEIQQYIETILSFESYAHKEMEHVTVDDINSYFNHLIQIKENTYNNVVHFTRYLFYIDKKDEYIHMTKYFNSIGVLENILERIALYESKELQKQVMEQIELPPFGTNSMELPKYTKDFMDKLNKYLPRVKCNKILAGNNHNIPASSFDKEREFYQQFDTFEEYLKDRHDRKVKELEYHYENNLVWFEQIITEDAIDYVKSNQEILSGVIKDKKLYVTKIPYDISNFLRTSDDKMKRYYACHCSFVRENILSEKEDIPKEWCYCSGGFAKYPFEQVLEEELDIKLLKTPIDGDIVCRFEIDLEHIDYK